MADRPGAHHGGRLVRPATRRRGFTLLEILAAFIVLAVAGGALLQLYQGSLQNVALAAEYSEAALLARSKLAELEARAEVVPGEEQGEFDERYRWQLTLTPYLEADGSAPPEARLQAMHLDLAVSWGEGGDERRYGVETLLLTEATEVASQ
jgi:general secretion pathway protein I